MAEKTKGAANAAPMDTSASSSSSSEDKPARERAPGVAPLAEHLAAAKLEPWKKAALLARLRAGVARKDGDPIKVDNEQSDISEADFHAALDVALHGGA